MKLQNKLLLSQILVFLATYALFGMLLSNIIYMTVSKNDYERAMSFNEQIMTRIDQNFEELQRFSAVVANDSELYALIDQYDQEPSDKTLAKISLHLSQIGIRDNIRSYRVIGIYIEIEDMKKMQFATVGFSDTLKQHIQNILPLMEEGGAADGFMNSFKYKGESATVFGNKFNSAYGYVNNFSWHGHKGTVTVISSFDQIMYIAEDMAEYSNDFMLLNNKNKVVVKSEGVTGIDIKKALSKMTYGESYQEGFYKEANAVETIRFSNYGGWKIICRLTKKDILHNNKSLILLDGILVAAFGICVVVIMMPLVRRFTKPLSEVSEQLNEIAKGNLSARVQIMTKDEIAEVGTSFNIMAEKLQDNINQMLEQEKREQKMKYSLLVSQVDPHFIYNTMNTITYLAQRDRCEDVIAVNKAMISILRDRLRINLEDVFDTIEQEINVVRDYLTIQSYRYMDVFKTQIEIEDEVREMFIAKNILQPLVENALFHGILCNRDEEGELMGGCIKIGIMLDGNRIVISITDNGAGMSPDLLLRLEQEDAPTIRGKHIGIRNIKGRMKYIYGDNYSFAMNSKEWEGTQVQIQLPIVTVPRNA